MTRYLTIQEVLEIYHNAMEQSGGLVSVRDIGALESSLTQPQMVFGGQELYPDIVEKAAVLGFLLIQNHPFLDGNKRTGHAAMETFLVLNGWEITADLEEQVTIILQVAASQMKRDSFLEWVRANIRPVLL